jgi:RNA polymerase sigma factor (TIGR02999 family)
MLRVHPAASFDRLTCTDTLQWLNRKITDGIRRWHDPRKCATLYRTHRVPRHCLRQITELLGRMRAGDVEARDAVFAAAYEELRRLARARLRGGGRNTVLETTSLVHEAYLRFVHSGELRAEDRRAFFAYASQVMRSVILNSVRERKAERRGGDAPVLTLSTELADDLAADEDTILKVHEALEILEQADGRLARVVEMRYFGGYSEQEIAETLEVTERTVRNDWQKARIMLMAALR